MGPLVRERMEFREAFVYAFHSETASIAVVEVAAIAGEATMSEPRFRAAPVVSLSAGLLAAHPVNLLLNSRDVAGRMVNPAEMA